MIRILMMVLKNLWRVPGAYIKLWHYARHTERYTKEEMYAHIQYIMKLAVSSGNIDLKTYGVENIPKEDGFLMYGNHQGLFDIVGIAATCDKAIGAVLKKELCSVPFLRLVKDCTNSFPMDRADVRQSMQVIQSVTKAVKNGGNYLIFPEGTRSKKGNEMLDFHSGSFKCATMSHCPIVPIALLDCFKVLDQKGLKKVAVQIHYLKPIFYEQYKGMNTTELAALVKSRIQETIDRYKN